MREGKTRRERARSSSGKVVRGGDCVLHCMSWAAGLPPVYMLVTTHLTNGAVSAPRNETCHDVVFLHPSIPLSFCPSIRPSVRPSICPPVRPSVCPSTRPSVCPTVRPSLCLSVRPSVRSSVRPSGRPPLSPDPPSVPPSLPLSCRSTRWFERSRSSSRATPSLTRTSPASSRGATPSACSGCWSTRPLRSASCTGAK